MYADLISGLQTRPRCHGDACWGVFCVLNAMAKLRTGTDVPNTVKALIRGFLIDEAKIAILTEERLQLVKPQSGKTGLDNRYDEDPACGSRGPPGPTN